MTGRIPTGIIPDSECPKCAAPLVVLDKRDPNAELWGRNPQFVGCTNFQVTGCNYRRKVNEQDRAVMEAVRAEFEALPAEF